METLGQRILRLRVRAGLSQRQLSRRTGGLVLHSTIAHLEKGRVKNATVETVRLLADALECDPSILAGFSVPVPGEKMPATPPS